MRGEAKFGKQSCHLPGERLLFATNRGVAQPGSVLAWGASGRRFKSFRPDHKIPF